MRTINSAARALIEWNEGCVLHAYLDIVHVVTIGYGHTGHDVEMGETITQAQADALLDHDLSTEFEPGIVAALGVHPCTDNQFGAMVSLAYNVGVGGEEHSTVQRLHNAGDYTAAANAFLLWDEAGGKVVPALQRRRAEERALYLTPDGSDTQVAPAAPVAAVPQQLPHLAPTKRVTAPAPKPRPVRATPAPSYEDSDAAAEDLDTQELNDASKR